MSEPGTEVGRRALGIAADLLRADAGERAAARRMDAGGAPLFWRVVARYGIAPREEEKWRRITKMLALLTPASATQSLHVDGRLFGAVLADGGDARAHLTQPAFSEQRLARLLAARGPARLEALERAVRALARAQPKLDVPSLAWAVLNEDGRAIARAYYARLDRRSDTPQDTPVEEKSDV